MAHTIIAQMRHKLDLIPIDNDLHFPIPQGKVTITTSKLERLEEFEIRLQGGDSEESLLECFYTLYEMLFFILGHFPALLHMTIDGREHPIDRLAGKYFTSNHFIKANFQFSEVNEATVNENSYNKFANFRDLSFATLQYIVSQRYDQVVVPHKLVLLL